MRKLAIAASLCSLAACHSYGLRDDLDFDLDFFEDATSSVSSQLHSPYVLGASLSFFAMSSRSDEDFTGWTITSSDARVIEISDAQSGPDAYVAVSGFAKGAGSATLSLVDRSGQVRASSTVQVDAPDELRVEAHGPLIIGDEASAQTSRVELLAEGTSTFMVRWFAAGQELWGTGALTASSDAVEVTTLTTEWSCKRDWLQLRGDASSTSGDVFLGNLQRSAPMVTLPVALVSYGDVATLEMRGQDERGVSDDSWLAVLVQARDASGAPIYGVDYSFDVDGEAQEGLGDIYRYQYEGGTPKMLTATLGQLQTSAQIHAGAGYVDSSNNVGCDSASAGASSFVALLGLAGLLRRRRVG